MTPARTVIVAGAGIGGLTTALALKRNGFRVIVFEQAERLSPGGTTQALLALAALLDGHGIPAMLFGAPAARGFIMGGAPATGNRIQGAMLVAERTGLLSTDLNTDETLAQFFEAHPMP